MREDVASLVRAERLADAASLALANGDAAAASELFERACDFPRAADAALLGGDRARALTLAALGGADTTAQAALDELVKDATETELRALADGLRHRGHLAWAARTYEAGKATESAAEAWERAGEYARAARLLEDAGEGQGAVRAARVLEAGLRRDEGRADLLVLLGALMLRSGRAAHALRALQRVPDGAAEKREALELSLKALTELGMTDARAEVVAQLHAMGSTEPLSSAERERNLPASRAPATSVAARLYGRYEVVREVSSTATARLLECRDVLRGERVAVKLFSAQGEATRGAGRDALAHFIREARVLARLSHPNIVPLYDVLEQGPALVLEWMPGGTLEAHLASEVFTPARAADIACAILGALGEAHRLGVVHRDVKPANILFDAAGTARLSDFGVAHLGDLSVTATAGTFGSLAYISPEQREGRPATAQSDVFGVGVVLLEMLTGQRPDTRTGSFGREADALQHPLATTHRHLDARNDAAVASLVALDPDRRPRDAFGAARALAALPWPTEHDANRPHVPRARPRSVRPPPERLDRLSSPPQASAAAVRLARDRWLDRTVVCVPLTPRLLARAAVFGRAFHPALQPVLRVDRESGTLWLGAARGATLDRPLEPGERATLESALSLLHRAGFVHGRIDRDAIAIESGAPLLRFPLEEVAGAHAANDLAALAEL